MSVSGPILELMSAEDLMILTQSLQDWVQHHLLVTFLVIWPVGSIAGGMIIYRIARQVRDLYRLGQSIVRLIRRARTSRLAASPSEERSATQ